MVSRSCYYNWLDREPSQEPLIKTHIKAIHKQSRGTYGSPRIHRTLTEMGFCIGHNKVSQLMREQGLRGIPRRRRKYSSQSQEIIRENLLQRDFTVQSPNKAWVVDITQIRSTQGWLYLSVVLDLYSRRIVGWSTDNHQRTSLPLSALEQALTLREPTPGLIHHSDRGSQYTSSAYQSKLSSASLRSSMSGAGDCLDNAVVESFFSVLKRECLYRKSWETRLEVSEAIDDYIVHFYNSTRQHSNNNGKSPIEAEELFYQSQQQ